MPAAGPAQAATVYDVGAELQLKRRQGAAVRVHICTVTWVSALTTGVCATAAETAAEVDESTGLEEIVVVETRLDDDMFSLGEGVSTDGTENLAARPVDTEQLFRSLPGFSVSRPGGAGGVSEIFLRGAESNFTVVYVDGIRLNNPSNTRGGSFDFSMLGAHGIDRVDSASGTMSAVYGADAMAGVIRIRSAWADPGSANLFVEAGSVGDWRAGAGASFELGNNLEWNVRASSLDGGDEIEGSSLRLDSFGTRLAGGLGDRGSWQINLRHVQRDRTSFSEVSGGPQFAVSRELETADGDELSVAAVADWPVTESWRSEVHISSARLRDNASMPAVAPGVLGGQPAFTAITDYERRELLWINRVELPGDAKIVGGLDFVAEDASDKGAVDLGFAVFPSPFEMTRSVSSAFAEIGRQWNGGLTSTLALRWDHGDVDGRLSGKIGVSRAVSDRGSRLWAHIGNGFKLPSFFALGNPLVGNPDLIAEKARSAEAGYTHVFGNGNELILTAFRSRYDDLVDFDFESFTNVNRGRIDIDGVQIRTDLELSPGVGLSLDSTWSDISSLSGPLRRRPERMGGVSLDWAAAQRWHVNARARYVGPRLTTSIPTGDVDASSYVLVGATVRYERVANRTVWAAIDNALDAQYQDAPGFPSPGARIRIGFDLGL